MRAARTLAPAILAAFAATPATALLGASDEIALLTPSDGDPEDWFGWAVAMDGTTVLVGAPRDEEHGLHSGSAYLFDALTGRELAKLVPDDGAQYDRFGHAVAILGTTAAVAAPGHGPSGSIYLYDASSALLVRKIEPVGVLGDIAFGHSIAVSSARLLVGAPEDDQQGNRSGSAFLFDLLTGEQEWKLLPQDGASLERFGTSVALTDALAVIGSQSDDYAGEHRGSVYVFDPVWGRELRELTASDGAAIDHFGRDVALEGSALVVGAPFNDEPGEAMAGAAYLFDALSGVEAGRLAPNPEFLGGDELGASVAMSGSLALVGAAGDNERASDAGAAFLFDLATRQPIAKLTASDGAVDDFLGASVALSGTICVAGAFGADHLGVDSGAVYVFSAAQSIAVPYCFGQGSGTPCPCSNAGALGHGCANGAFAEGAHLWAERAPSVSEDDLILRAWSTPPHQPGLFFQGDDALNGGLGIPFGDGLRCAWTHVVRLEVDTANAAGRSFTTIPIAATVGLLAGDVKRYQWWYRDPAASPCGAGFNLSNGLEVVWGP